MKKLNYLIFALILMLGVSFEVKAAAADDIACITASGKQQCVLSEDIEATETLRVQGEIELDLNGHTIRPASNTTIKKSAVLAVLRDAKLTIKDSVGNGKITSNGNTMVYGAVIMTLAEDGETGRDATLVVDGGTLEGYYYAVVGNGKRHGTNITINGGTLTSESSTGLGIYHPQDGTLVINGGNITSGTGIEMRSGSLTVKGGTIEGNAPLNVTPNGSGSTTEGVGIAIAQHNTEKNINVQITGGTISGYYAVYESNPQGNANVAEKVNLSIKGGTFNATSDAALYSQDLEKFIISGTFNKAIDANYVSNIAKIYESNGSYVIAPDNYNAVTANTSEQNVNVGIDATYESAIYTAPVETYDIDLSWDDLHWVFVYEGDPSTTNNYVWLTKEKYDEESASMPDLSSNDVNGAILADKLDMPEPTLNIAISNHSVFAVDIAGSVESKNGVTNYTNSAGLQIALEETTPSYTGTVNVVGLACNGNANLLVKPTATRFVNDSGLTATVEGEVKLIFSKAS